MKYALIDSLGTTAYVVAVAVFMYFGSEDAFGTTPSVFAPIVMLMLLVLSVAIVGSLMFGRPAMWYVDGKKKDALRLLVQTLGIFLIVTVLVIVLLIGFFARQ